MKERILGFVMAILGVFLSLVSFYKVKWFLFGGPAVDMLNKTNWVLFFIGIFLIVLGVLLVVKFSKKVSRKK